MTDNDPPVTRFFELQRETIRETGEFLERVVELPADSGDGLSVERQRELTAETVELARESTHRSLDTVEAVAGDGPADVEDVRETVDSAFDSALDGQTEAFEFIEEGSGDLEEAATARIDEQVELFLEVSEEVEQQLTEVAEQFVEQAEEGELTAGFEQQLDEVAEQLGQQAERFADLEEQFETIDVSGPGE
jgi:methyl-accepting chemotaxis protein